MTRMVKFFSALATVTFLLFNSSVWAWNAMGHMIVAQLAYQQISPTAKKKIDKLVNAMHEDYAEITSFQQLAYWPDALRSQKIDTYVHWHYIDNAIAVDNMPTKNLIDSDNALWAYKLVGKVVANDHANPHEQARFLGFLIHIIADLHQPLHTVSRISLATPNGDKGGNLFKVYLNHKATNLHKLWDSALGWLPKGNDINTAVQLADELNNKFPSDFFAKKPKNDNAESWVAEGITTAKNQVYAIEYNADVNATYLRDGELATQQALALAGYRLANVLDQLFS